MPTVAVLCATCRPGHHCECDVRSFCPSAWAGSARSPLGLRLQGCFWVCQAEGRAKATATRRRSAWTGQSAGRSLPLSSRLRGGPPRSPGLPADSAPARSAPPCGFGSQSPTEMWQVRTLSIQCEVWLRHGLFQNYSWKLRAEPSPAPGIVCMYTCTRGRTRTYTTYTRTCTHTHNAHTYTMHMHTCTRRHPHAHTRPTPPRGRASCWCPGCASLWGPAVSLCACRRNRRWGPLRADSPRSRFRAKTLPSAL